MSTHDNSHQWEFSVNDAEKEKDDLLSLQYQLWTSVFSFCALRPKKQQ